jgi:hypothetical protein
MAVVVDVDAGTDTLVADTTIRAYAASGSRVLDIPLLEMVHISVGADVASVRTIVAVDYRIVELVIDEGPFEALAPALWALAARGWDVVTLTPARRMGEAHRALRGTPCSLQPWWLVSSAVHFGARERP